MKYFVILTSWIILMGAPVYGQKADLRADVNKNTIEEGEVLRYTITMENGEERNLTPPDFEGFDVLSTSRSSQMSVQIVNGRQEVKKTQKITYLLRPLGPGEKIIGKAYLKSDNGTLSTDPIKIKVVKSGTLPANKKKNKGPDVSTLPRKDIFLRAYLSKNEVYRGEQVVLYYKLYFRNGINNYEMPATSLSGFWSKEIEIKKPDVKRETINGIAYRTAVLRKLILFPQKSGDLVIPEAEMTVDVQYSFFDTRRIKIKSNSVKLKVKDLPPGAPSEFNGAVGRFKLESTLSSTEARVNEPITFRVKVSGTGNIQLIDLPEPRLPDDFEVYDPKINEYVSTRGDVLTGTKSYEYLLVPRQRGEYKMDSLVFAWFDPELGQYRSAHTPSYKIKVSGEAMQESSKNAISGISKEDIELLDQDIRYIKMESNLKKKGLRYFASPLFYFLLISPVMLFFILLLLRARKNEKAVNAEAYLQRKAARKALKRIEKLAKAGLDDKAYFEAVPNILWDYLGERIGLDRSEQTHEKFRKKLSEMNLDPVLADELEAILEKCRAAVYAPSLAGMSREEIAASAKEWIKRFEKEVEK